LGRVGDQEVLLLRKRIHPGAGSEIVGRLSSTVQHDDERDGLIAPLATRDEMTGSPSGARRGIVSAFRGSAPGVPSTPPPRRTPAPDPALQKSHRPARSSPMGVPVAPPHAASAAGGGKSLNFLPNLIEQIRAFHPSPFRKTLVA
jgi:hypothetical protein